eukprot:3026272-Alexandrium_andersonii.AAC.1
MDSSRWTAALSAAASCFGRSRTVSCARLCEGGCRPPPKRSARNRSQRLKALSSSCRRLSSAAR